MVGKGCTHKMKKRITHKSTTLSKVVTNNSEDILIQLTSCVVVSSDSSSLLHCVLVQAPSTCNNHHSFCFLATQIGLHSTLVTGQSQCQEAESLLHISTVSLQQKATHNFCNSCSLSEPWVRFLICYYIVKIKFLSFVVAWLSSSSKS